MFYTIDGLNLIVKVQSIQLHDGILRIQVADSNGVKFTTTAEYLRDSNNPDIGWIPTSIQEYRVSADHLTDEHLERISNPQHLLPLQQESLSLHHRLFHLSFTVMLQLAKLGILPRRFLKLRNNLPPLRVLHVLAIAQKVLAQQEVFNGRSWSNTDTKPMQTKR